VSPVPPHDFRHGVLAQPNLAPDEPIAPALGHEGQHLWREAVRLGPLSRLSAELVAPRLSAAMPAYIGLLDIDLMGCAVDLRRESHSCLSVAGADRTRPADLDSAGRLRGSMGACRSRTNADDRLPADPLGRIESGDGSVEGRDVADVRPQSSVTHPLDDLTQLGAI
jgi:hypothetical protein